MLRIRFTTDEHRIRGNYLLATNGVVRRLRGQLFEIAERDRKLLDKHQLHYTVVRIPDPTGSDDEVRNPLAAEL
jgi:hypothetical protein